MKAVYYEESAVNKKGLLAELVQREKPPTVARVLKEQLSVIRAIAKQGVGYEQIAAVFEDVGVAVDANELATFCLPKKQRGKGGKKSPPEQYLSLERSLTPEQVDRVVQALEILKAKKPGLTLVEVIECHFQSITAAIDNGWSVREIIKSFEDGGLRLQCTESSFLQRLKQVRAAKRKASETVDTDASSVVPHQPKETNRAQVWPPLSVPDKTAIEKEFLV